MFLGRMAKVWIDGQERGRLAMGKDMRHRGVISVLLLLGWATHLAASIPISIVNNLPGTFVDISNAGTLLSIPSDGSTVVSSGGVGNLLFPPGNIVVAENGGLGFQNPPDNNLPPVNTPIPSVTIFGGGQAILGYYSNIMACPGKMGGVYQATTSTSEIIQYHGMCVPGALRGGNPDLVDFEIKIFNNPIPAPGIFAQIIYADIQRPGPNGGAIATIGYQDDALGNNDFQWSFNTAGSVMDGTVLSIVPEPASAILVALLGWVLARRPDRTRRISR